MYFNSFGLRFGLEFAEALYGTKYFFVSTSLPQPLLVLQSSVVILSVWKPSDPLREALSVLRPLFFASSPWSTAFVAMFTASGALLEVWTAAKVWEARFRLHQAKGCEFRLVCISLQVTKNRTEVRATACKRFLGCQTRIFITFGHF